MSSSFDVPEVDFLTTGTIGPPGQRIFFLQFGSGEQVVTLRLEKSQVAALCRYLDTILSDLPGVEAVTTDMALIEPVAPEWVIGSLGVTYEEGDDRIVLIAEELVEEGEDGARARIGATRSQMAAFSRHGAALVAAGRPPCPLCGGPLDEEHVCVRLNGHRNVAP